MDKYWLKHTCYLWKSSSCIVSYVCLAIINEYYTSGGNINITTQLLIFQCNFIGVCTSCSAISRNNPICITLQKNGITCVLQTFCIIVFTMIKLYGLDEVCWRPKRCVNEHGFLNATSVKMLFLRCVEMAVSVLQRYGLIPKSPLGRIKIQMWLRHITLLFADTVNSLMLFQVNMARSDGGIV